MHPRYRIPRRLVAELATSALASRQRPFLRDAERALASVQPGPEWMGTEHIPRAGPALVVCNHYTRPGLGAWWFVMAVSVAIAHSRAPGADRLTRWVMAEAWSYLDSHWRERWVSPVTRWAFRRVAAVYGFVPMPPMPPRPAEVAARAGSVLRTVRLARSLGAAGGMLGLAPEGGDVPQGVADLPVAGRAEGALMHGTCPRPPILGSPPDGVGEFIALLVKAGLPVLPVGIWEAGPAGANAGGPCRLKLSFGPCFAPVLSTDRASLDAAISAQVMAAISRQLPGEGEH